MRKYTHTASLMHTHTHTLEGFFLRLLLTLQMQTLQTLHSCFCFWFIWRFLWCCLATAMPSRDTHMDAIKIKTKAKTKSKCKIKVKEFWAQLVARGQQQQHLSPSVRVPLNEIRRYICASVCKPHTHAHKYWYVHTLTTVSVLPCE